MELERFLIIKERISEIVKIMVALENETLKLSDEEEMKINEELEQFAVEIHNSDLSNIPFEEYQGFFDLGFDFNGTGANIDFQIINLSFNDSKVRFKGCNIKNLDLSKFKSRLLDDSSFDSAVIEENPEYFAPKKITDVNVRNRYYSFNLTLEDLKKYDLKDESINHSDWSLRNLINQIGIDNVLALDEEIVDLLGDTLYSRISSNLTFESSREEIEDILRSIVIEEIDNRFSRTQRAKLLQSKYVREHLSEYVIDFSDDQQELKGKYFENELELSDIVNNLELFRGKKFISGLNSSLNYKISSDFPNLTEEQIIYLADKLPDIVELLKNNPTEFIYVANEINIEMEQEENQSAIIDLYKRYVEENPRDTYSSRGIFADLLTTEMSSYEELINNPNLDIFDYYKQEMLKLVKNPNFNRLEELDDLNIKEMIKSGEHSFFEFFNRYGINTVLDFEAENGALFTQNNGYNIKFISDAYMHYAGNNHDPETSLYEMKLWDDTNPEYSKEQFEEFIRRMIVYGPTDDNYRNKNKLDYRNLRGPFREDHPDLFLPEDAPAELQDKFYTSEILIEDILSHPEYISYLKDADVGISLEYLPFKVDGRYREGWHFIKEKAGSAEVALSFITENLDIINYLKKGSDYSLPEVLHDMSLDDAIVIFNKEIEDRIINHGLSYGEDAPKGFKANHEDYFLAEEAPDALKDAFYPDRRKKVDYQSVIFDEAGVENLSKQEGWQQYLIDKNKDITKAVLTDFIAKADNQAVKETFLYYLEKDQNVALGLIGSMTAEQILQTEVILPEEQLETLIEQEPDNALKILLFSEKVDKDKLLLLSKYKEINTQTNTLDSALLNIYLENNVDTDTLNKKIDEIYNLFTYDNVSEFLKTYKLFELGKFASAENNRIKSYDGADQKTKRKIILADLFRISLDSDNKSLKYFSNIMKYGDEILEKVSQNGEIDLSGLSEEEYAVFSQYVDTLVTMHNISVNNAENKTMIEFSHDAKTDFEMLQQQYKSGEVQFSSSKVLTGLFNGEVASEITPDSILQYMAKKKESRSKQVKENSSLLKDKSLKLESGDFIKGIEGFESYLKSMLRYGLKCGEFNREYSHSDGTKLDLDFGYVSDANFQLGQETDYDVIATTISHIYGSTYIVLKDYGKKFESEGQTQDDMPIKFSRGPEYWTNHQDDTKVATNKDRYVRTGVGVLDIDYIVSKEWKTSFGYEMAMAGVFIPVKNEKDELIFSYEDYEAIRTQMKGLSYYETEPFEADEKVKQMDGLYEIYRSLGGDEQKIEACKEIIEGKEDSVTVAKKKATLELLKEFFEQKGIHVVDNLSSDLSIEEVELIDTGSTGRGTNVPGDGDFDFMLRHNLPTETLSELQSYIFSLKKESGVKLKNGFRTKQTVLPDGQQVDIDITYAKKDLSLEYSSDMSIKDRLNSIKEASTEDYNYVRANIIMAKNILKKMGIYKKIGSDGATEHGGFGGIGVENWILQNGGSFAQATDTYLEATKDEKGNDLSYQKFIEKYPIYDFGNNHREGKLPHDRFSAFLGKLGELDHEQAFAFVKNTFTGIQRDLRIHQEIKESAETTKDVLEEKIETQLEAQDEPRIVQEKDIITEQEPCTLRKSISVESLREASKNRFTDFCKDNFVLMAKLVAKYSKTREENQNIVGDQLKDEGVSL